VRSSWPYFLARLSDEKLPTEVFQRIVSHHPTDRHRSSTGQIPVVVLRNVVKTYVEGDAERRVLDGVSLEVERGEFVVLLGRSGSGKTTLLNLISGIDQPTSGDLIVAGESLPDLSEKERTLFRRRRVGFVFQAYNLIPTLTTAENVRLPMELTGTSEKEAAFRAGELLSAVGLGDRASTFPDRLSGGEQQRVAIARALAHDPDLVLADEPTGNLDIETAGIVLDLLQTLLREEGKTLILVTHDRSIGERADRTIELHGGQIVSRPILG
jgi:putative ABC transport system ATP-binding protein